MITLKVADKRVGPIIGRHPWVFSQAILNIPTGLASGEPVKLTREDGRFLAQGYFNAYSQIAVRLWSYDELEEVNQGFFARRIERAFKFKSLYLAGEKTDSFRLINSENDFLPGLIVDKYADYLVVQCHTSGIERWKKEIIDALVAVVKPVGIYEKSDSTSRKFENLPDNKAVLYGQVPDRIKIQENGLYFWVDVIGGQKTGFFLDQRDKRQALKKYSRDTKVLNCFSYTGGFSVYALAGGASEVVSVDASAPALELAKENFKLNGLNIKKCSFVCEDVKKYLDTIKFGQFGVIVLDPPAFIKDRRKKIEGVRGYRFINEQAIKLLPADGILVTCSCSAHLSLQDFRFMLSEAAGRSSRSVQILETFIHGLDHAELASFMEGEYLKCYFSIVS